MFSSLSSDDGEGITKDSQGDDKQQTHFNQFSIFTLVKFFDIRQEWRHESDQVKLGEH